MSVNDKILTVEDSRHSAQPVTVRLWAMTTGAAKKVFWEWPERARQRRDLARLDGRMLGDLGISKADVDSEFRKARWQR
ncbi:MAG: DUF1127 domain-containing protein [Pseudomonadota bacterium]